VLLSANKLHEILNSSGRWAGMLGEDAGGEDAGDGAILLLSENCTEGVMSKGYARLDSGKSLQKYWRFVGPSQHAVWDFLHF
jgi:hypothetical protein